MKQVGPTARRRLMLALSSGWSRPADALRPRKQLKTHTPAGFCSRIVDLEVRAKRLLLPQQGSQYAMAPRSIPSARGSSTLPSLAPAPTAEEGGRLRRREDCGAAEAGAPPGLQTPRSRAGTAGAWACDRASIRKGPALSPAAQIHRNAVTDIVENVTFMRAPPEAVVKARPRIHGRSDPNGAAPHALPF